jgi:lipid-binding SYLF domain-containing protein
MNLLTRVLTYLFLSINISYSYSANSQSGYGIDGNLFPSQDTKTIQELLNPRKIIETQRRFDFEFRGGKELLKKAEAYLIFPEVYDVGLIIGGKYGYGALIKNNRIKARYRIYSTSIGIKAGVKRYSLVILFMTKNALNRFLYKEEWKLGLDSYFTFTNYNAGVDLNSLDLRKDTIVIPFNSMGVMADISFEGTVFQRIFN